MKSMLIIGMGTLGVHLASKLQKLGNEVMIVDENPDIIDELSSRFSDAQIGDCTNSDVLKSFGIGNFDICFVTVGENFQASLEITALLKELGAKYVVSKAKKDIQEKFLLKNGADEVIYPERDIAENRAMKYSDNCIFNYIKLSDEYGVFELSSPDNWIGKSIRQLDIRNKHSINIVAIKNDTNLFTAPDADYVFKEQDHMIVVGNNSFINKLKKVK